MNKTFPLAPVRWSIKQKITGGFALLVLVCALVIGLNIVGLNSSYDQFTQFRIASDDTRRMLQIDRDVSDLQRYILAYSNTEKNTTITQIEGVYAQLVSDIEHLANELAASEGTHQKNMSNLLNAVQQFHEKIISLRNERAYRTELVLGTLEAKYHGLKNQMEDIHNSAESADNEKLLQQLWKVKTLLFELEDSGDRYFLKHEFKARQDFHRYQSELNVTLTELRLLAGTSPVVEAIVSMQKSLAEIPTFFSQAVQADRNYLFLVNVVIAGESAEITNLTAELKAAQLTKQQTLFSSATLRMEEHRKWVLFVSVFGILAAMLLAYIIGRSISGPLQSITHTFARLARGENLSEIPGHHRSDEIGHLAQAANVFRETNARTVSLLEQTERIAQTLKERELELQQAVLQAQDANEAKSQFLAKMSHELRTPMNAVLGMLTLLRRTELAARQQDYVDKSENAARSLLNLLNDILDLSRAEAGKIELDISGFDLDRMLDDLNIILTSNIGDKPIKLQIEIDVNVPRKLLGDAFRLQQVLINLGGNAIKFTPAGTVRLTVSLQELRHDLAHLTFSVSDTGIGIAAENQQKIFGGFTQAETSIARRFGGTGLGLSISQHLVSLMGGQLSLESEPGVGSRFFFSITLPVLAADERAPLKELQPLSIQARRLVGMKILLAEDNLFNQQIARELLEAEGAQVEVAGDGNEALSRLQSTLQSNDKTDFDAVLMDMQMPVLDGLEATRRLRTVEGLRDLPVIAMTANAMQGDREACLEAGMNDHIGKPFDLAHLVQVLHSHCAAYQSAKAQPGATDSCGNATQGTSATSTAGLEIQQPEAGDFDAQGAIARFGGNDTLYFAMLPQLIDSLKTHGKKILQARDAGDWEAACKGLHSLKGAASTTGLMRLAECADRAERSLLQTVSTTERQSALLAVNDLLTSGLCNVESLLSSR